MKKLLRQSAISIIALLCVVGVANAQTVVSGDTMWKIAKNAGISLSQLIVLNPQVTNPSIIHPGDEINTGTLGSSIPSTPALIDAYLTANIDKTQTTMILSSGVDRGGNTLTGYMCFTIDVNTPTVEYVCGTATGATISGMLRGVDVTNPNTTSSALAFGHRRFASVQISDYPSLQILSRIMNGQDGFPNVLKYDTSPTITDPTQIVNKGYVDSRNGYYEAPVANFAALPTGQNNGEMRVTLDDGKVYTWSGSTWILAGAGGGAGTVYRDDITVTSSSVLIYQLSSGSWPDKKYLQVFRNGQLLAEGASADYQASTTGYQITLNSAPVAGEVITLRVESIDFYNAAWTSVNDNLIPDTNNSKDIGSSSLKFKDLYLAGNASIGGNTTIGGILGVTGTTTLATTSISNLTVNGSTQLGFQTIQVVSTTGTSTWSVPTGVKKVRVRIVGGGASGTSIPGSTSGSSVGGGGGGYSEKIVDVSATSSISITVGAAAATSSFSSFLWASGGNVQSGGVGYNGAININGSDGGAATYASGAGVALAGFGGNSVLSGSSVGVGKVYGGGGSGCTSGGAGCSGSTGASGVVIIEY